MNELKLLCDIADIGKLIPNGIDLEGKINCNKIHISNIDGNIKINIEPEGSQKAFDDTEIKKLIEEFKEGLSNLDDSIFVESVEKASKAIDTQRFDELLKLQKFSEKEATEVEYMIDYFCQIIFEVLEDNIQKSINEIFKS